MNRFKRLAKYLLPYKFTILFLILSMFLQQICSLFMPTFMAEIVDVGIRQSGIEIATPNALSTQAYDLITTFMTKDQKRLVSGSYELIGKKEIDDGYSDFNVERQTLKKREINEVYPLINETSIYVLKKSQSENVEKLNDCFEKASLAAINYIKQNGKESAVAEGNDNKYYNINLDVAYSVESEAKKLTESNIKELSENNENNIDLKQTSAMLNKQFYKELKFDMVKNQNAYILKIGAIMLLITILSMIITIYESYLSSKMSAGISMKLRSDVFNKIESFSNKEFDEMSTSSLITRTTNDVSQVQEVILTLIQLVSPPLMLAGGLIMALKKSVSLSWTIALGAIVSTLIVAGAFALIIPKVKIIQKLLDKLNLIIRERLMGTMVIKLFGTSYFEEERFKKANLKLTDISLFVNRVTMFMSPILMIFMNLINVLIIWLGAYEIENSSMQVGDMLAFMQYASMVIGSFLMLMTIFMMLPREMVSINRVCEILEKETSVKDPENPKHFPSKFIGDIEFKNVSFKYTGAKENVVSNISFKANHGEVTAIIGSTGSGKSTLVNLIPRFYDVTEGEVLVGGINVKDLKQTELREKIGFVSQKGVLFSGDIESNLKYGKNKCSDEKMKECIEIAQMKSFVNKQEDGIKMEISQGGNNVSGGQRQRLSIARALVKDAGIYIFDDSFSALDFKTEAELRKALLKYTKDATVLIVSQRIGTIMKADKIVVLNDGKIAGVGTHEELMESCGVYREIALSQLPEEALV